MVTSDAKEQRPTFFNKSIFFWFWLTFEELILAARLYKIVENSRIHILPKNDLTVVAIYSCSLITVSSTH